MGCNKNGPEEEVAELHRFLSLDDKLDTQIFTFLLANPFDHNFEKVQSREFAYANNRWRLSIVKAEHNLHFYLQLLEATDGLVCSLDYAFSVLNRGDYARNETFSESGCQFTKRASSHGRRSMISRDEILHDGYLDENHQLLVELTVKDATTTFECEIDMRQSSDVRFPRHQSSYLSLAGFDWNVSVYPNGDWADHEGRVMVNLNRLTQFNHFCRVRYRITIGDDSDTKCYTTDTLDDTFDFGGDGHGFQLYDDLERYMQDDRLKIVVEFLQLSVIRETKIYVFEDEAEKNQVYFVDLEKQTWCIESDVTKKNLRFRLHYIDQYRLPNNYARYLRWDVVVVGEAGQRKRALEGPFSEYFARRSDETACEMVTELPVKELADPDKRYFSEGGPLRLTVHVEFLISHLLYKANYDKQDDVSRRQIYQLKKQLLPEMASSASPSGGSGPSGHRAVENSHDSADDSGRGSKVWNSSVTSD
ncbi:uncharacterized protein [Ptychodera flava]|uniref:uncharacterized protein n=1 Tax=Ptychodera flava TaxID=63121 RepID=UPI003969E955